MIIAPAAQAGTAQCAEIASPAAANKRRIRVIAEEVIAPALFFINETLRGIYSPCQLETAVRLTAWLPGRSSSGTFATEAWTQHCRPPGGGRADAGRLQSAF
ncbi:hypothetical protein MPLSOD_250027 [Mesorhizobium sp. SOD10]|nr:hypothetical protein MPLSOD_250027 [Mesorhizobium sp. SOD10]